MTDARFRVRLLRLVEIDGRTRMAGAIVELPAAQARTLIVDGKARLADPSDLKLMINYFAREAEVAR